MSKLATSGWIGERKADISSAVPQPQWYAVHIRSNFEHRVAAELAQKNVEHFLPVVQEVHRWRDRKKVVEVPVFAGYVFVRITDSAEFRLRVLRTSGAVRILGRGSEIEPVPDSQIESVKQLLKSKVELLTHPFLREGAWVRVKRGALSGLEGRLARVRNHTRLVLSVDLLSQSVSTEIDVQDVELVRAAHGDQLSAA